MPGGVSRAGVPTESMGNAEGDVGTTGGRHEGTMDSYGTRGAGAGETVIGAGTGGDRSAAAPHDA